MEHEIFAITQNNLASSSSKAQEKINLVVRLIDT
jgi:hypothetical protein